MNESEILDLIQLLTGVDDHVEAANIYDTIKEHKETMSQFVLRIANDRIDGQINYESYKDNVQLTANKLLLEEILLAKGYSEDALIKLAKKLEIDYNNCNEKEIRGLILVLAKAPTKQTP
jgi:hypothetical protein